MSEFENERIRGLPGPLPTGERILWRGAPCWRGLAWRAFHVREVLGWFALVGTVKIVVGVADGASLGSALAGQASLLLACIAASALLCGLAWLSARTTVYTITDRRIVMRIGIALPLTINLPHKHTSEAFLRLHRQGTGDLGIALAGGTRLAWLVLWPHARAWRLRHPQPMLRALPDAGRVADLLSGALAATADAGGYVRASANDAAPRAAVPPMPNGVGVAT